MQRTELLAALLNKLWINKLIPYRIFVVVNLACIIWSAVVTEKWSGILVTQVCCDMLCGIKCDDQFQDVEFTFLQKIPFL